MKRFRRMSLNNALIFVLILLLFITLYKHHIEPKIKTCSQKLLTQSVNATSRIQKKRTILFYHFHKCGGTSMCKYAKHNGELTSQLATCLVSAVDFREFDRTSVAQQSCIEQERYLRESSLTFVAVEYYFHWLQQCRFSQESNILTMAVLRHPASRLASQYVYQSKSKERILKPRSPAQLLQDSVRSENRFYVNEYMARRILNKFGDYFIMSSNISSAELQFALTALDNIDIVFPMERFCEARYVMKLRLGWNRFELEWTNTNFGGERLTAFEPESWRLIEEMNPADTALWNAANHRLDQELRKLNAVKDAKELCSIHDYVYIPFGTVQ